MANVEKDAITGTETTGHEWDGIKELNTPLPKWWLYTFYACILFAIGYWILYPSWPTLHGHWQGLLHYTSRGAFAQDQLKQKAERSVWTDKISSKTVDEIAADPELLNYSIAAGHSIFANNCAPCHGTNGSGNKNFPILADDDWLWGGTLDAIYTTVQYGIRAKNDNTRSDSMPNFGTDEILTPTEINDAAEYVLSLSGKQTDPAAAKKGETVFADNCAACHGDKGQGTHELGAPRLSDGIWLYSGAKSAIVSQITHPKLGVMPAWTGRLSNVEIKEAAVYVHSLGGGQ
ncbi:cytochrome-c oxidase, cbb3-type subunit III [Varunaivibrio sulfuroxidans]|uniref:Cbb3-type cytochrome c oxidase subunit n=1 Tax=Varunaivibrio sulfuroxidans TaxID=1773489 RepID=A0A4R3JE69_9PROT|nr:cytochrome-c oxidase, cbb3-type subunit III [Varunaivibrio sulfuroxidans]TCS64084.1 cytochrome c oxidase cbb3-type subunit 3 [Varunaivibrio sulfuroxidans]WES31466.1 cytochrome-c oxidase, cbb3-type subunit III [Varunaivibrio sulfuroxidans]